VVGRAAFAFERDFLAAIDLFLVFGCSDRFVSVGAPFAASLTRRTRPVKIDTSFEKAVNCRAQKLSVIPRVKRRGDLLLWPQADAGREVRKATAGLERVEILP
jgi:hypothetical protein